MQVYIFLYFRLSFKSSHIFANRRASIPRAAQTRVAKILVKRQPGERRFISSSQSAIL